MKFNELSISEPLLQALESEGYKEPTPIQERAIPFLLQGKDLLGIAQTGTGKTAAFTVPLLQHLNNHKKQTQRNTPRALILAPTRELAAQIDESIRVYGKNLKISHAVIFGGVSQFHQVKALNYGVDILTATPGRLLDLINQRHIRLDLVEVLILDEADRMLDMGFIRDVRRIVSLVPQRRQTLFFSATMPPEVVSLSKSMLNSPVRVEVNPQATTVELITQKVIFVDSPHKIDVLLELLSQEHLNRVLVFTRTKHQANKVTKKLMMNGVKADAIHGNKSQNARTMALDNFKNAKTRVLVATDIAARGIDIDSISHVINYELPNEPESYVHRIGRTARAGAKGVAYSLCSAEERDYLRHIERLIRQKIPQEEHKYMSNYKSTENTPQKSYGGQNPIHSGEQGYGRQGGSAHRRFQPKRRSSGHGNFGTMGEGNFRHSGSHTGGTRHGGGSRPSGSNADGPRPSGFRPHVGQGGSSGHRTGNKHRRPQWKKRRDNRD